MILSLVTSVISSATTAISGFLLGCLLTSNITLIALLSYTSFLFKKKYTEYIDKGVTFDADGRQITNVRMELLKSEHTVVLMCLVVLVLSVAILLS